MTESQKRKWLAAGLSILMLGMALVSMFVGKKKLRGPVAEVVPNVDVAGVERLEWYEPTEISPAPNEPVVTKSKPIVYSAGDEFQGMWKHRRKNSNLRMTVVAVDSSERKIRVTLNCAELGSAVKEMEGEVGEDGRILELRGLPGSGLDDPGERRSADVRDLLYTNSSQKLEIGPTADGLKGETESGAHVYFWARIPGQ